MPDSDNKREWATDGRTHEHLVEENRRLAQRYLDLESSTRRQLEKLREANTVLARGEAHMRLLLEDAAIGFALLDLNQRVVSANQTLGGILGYSQSELTGEFFSNYVYVGSLPAFSRLAAGVAGPGRGSENMELVGRNGGLVHCRLAVSDWQDEKGARKGTFILVFDVEDQVRALTRLREMEEAVAETDKSRKLFLDVISRELRTPASGIMGMIRMLMDTTLDERQAELAGVIHTSATSMVRLVDDMIDVVRLDAADARLTLTPIRPSELVQGVANLFGVRAEEKELEIKIDVSAAVPEWIEGDLTRIRRVLVHFMDNAIKFTEKGHINLSVDLVGDMVRFMVSDTGPGLQLGPSADPFADRVVEDTPWGRRHGGIGVGLPISRRLVAFMGGKIGYESEPGRGSEFHFTIPLQTPSEICDQDCAPPPEAVRLPPLRILLADGNPLTRRVVMAYLQFDGHHLTIVDNGLDALEKSRFTSFDLALIDLNLPKLDGIQALRLIRDDEKSSGRTRMPVVLMAGTSRLRNPDHYRRAGADGLLRKPIQPVELMLAIAEATGVTPLSVAMPQAPGQYAAETSGGSLRRIDGSQLVTLRQVMLDDQFMGILRFFMEDAIPGIIDMSRLADSPDPDFERIAFTASKARGMAGYLGFSALSELLTRIEAICRSRNASGLASLAAELPLVIDDTLEELKRILPEAFATISAMSDPMPEGEIREGDLPILNKHNGKV